MNQKQPEILGEKKLHEHGFVRLVEVMGSDQAIEAAARLSYGKGTSNEEKARTPEDTRNLIRYLVRHRHTSPLEQGVVRFHIKIPIFVMRQHVRHRTASMNEYSGRYSEMVDDMYVPDKAYIRSQSKTNKQGSGDTLDDPITLHAAHQTISSSVSHSYKHYKDLISMGVSRELARVVLPVANYTEAVWQINLHNFMHYLTLRTDKHAQQEIQDLANAMLELAKPYFPLCFEAWTDYQMDTKTLSRMELKLLSDIKIGVWIGAAKPSIDTPEMAGIYGMSKREWTEFFTWYDKL